MLSRIAKEGCPLIDSRKFEYVSNEALDETELSESMMVCGATLWVQNAGAEDGSGSTTSPLKPHYTKDMIKAKYFGGKVVDGIKEGLGITVEGLSRGTKATVSAAEKCTKEVAKFTTESGHSVEKGAKKSTQVPSEEHTPPRKSKLKSMFSPKRKKNKPQKGRIPESDDGNSITTAGNDDISVATDTLPTDFAHEDSDAVKEADVDDDFDANVHQVEETMEEEDEMGDFVVIKPQPYELVLDDVIDIRIVSFPGMSRESFLLTHNVYALTHISRASLSFICRQRRDCQLSDICGICDGPTEHGRSDQ